MRPSLHAFPADQVELLPTQGGIEHWRIPNVFHDRFALTRAYLLSLNSANLLRAHRLETGAFTVGGYTPATNPHGGWESADSQLRGHFLGHWLSAAARIVATTGDEEIAARARAIVRELAAYQRENGGEWVFSIPEKYLRRIAAGKAVWAPQYTVHKTLMGLLDTHALTGSREALAIVVRAARWFHRWTDGFSRERMDDVLDHETGGMLEVWADLFAITGEDSHRELMERYDRPRLFDRLLAGEDPLTNRHANTTIPEALGAARAYEVTGEPRWRAIVEAYWRCAVTERGSFATGGQGSYEVWTPPFELAARLGRRTQEHCTVYNMMRLADTLHRWTGEAGYADYLERNLYNGILAQQHPRTGMVAYYLPLLPGATKAWGTPTDSFWCCHGTMVQAHTTHNAYAFYHDEFGITVSQYVPTRLRTTLFGTSVEITQRRDPEIGTHVAAGDQTGARRRPRRWLVRLDVTFGQRREAALRCRVPWWVSGTPVVRVNGEPRDAVVEDGYLTLRGAWHRDTVELELPKDLWTEPLPDRPDTVAFMDGPVTLAGLCDEERTLVGDPSAPETILSPGDERDPFSWNDGYRVRHQDRGLRFVPLHEVEDEPYTVYFPVNTL